MVRVTSHPVKITLTIICMKLWFWCPRYLLTDCWPAEFGKLWQYSCCTSGVPWQLICWIFIICWFEKECPTKNMWIFYSSSKVHEHLHCTNVKCNTSWRCSDAWHVKLQNNIDSNGQHCCFVTCYLQCFIQHAEYNIRIFSHPDIQTKGLTCYWYSIASGNTQPCKINVLILL